MATMYKSHADNFISTVKLLIDHGAEISWSTYSLKGLENLGKVTRQSTYLKTFFINLDYPQEVLLYLLKAGASVDVLAWGCEMTSSPNTGNESILLCQALLLSGFAVNESEMKKLYNDTDMKAIDGGTEKLLQVLTQKMQNPPSLLRLCRVVIIRQLSTANNHRSIFPALQVLPLPEQTRQYLRLEENFAEIDLKTTTDGTRHSVYIDFIDENLQSYDQSSPTPE